MRWAARLLIAVKRQPFLNIRKRKGAGPVSFAMRERAGGRIDGDSSFHEPGLAREC